MRTIISGITLATVLTLAGPAAADTWVLWAKETLDLTRPAFFDGTKWKIEDTYASKAACEKKLRQNVSIRAKILHERGDRIIDVSGPTDWSTRPPTFTFVAPPLPAYTEHITSQARELKDRNGSPVMSSVSWKCWPVGVNPQ